jgi:hypothetical protein
MTTGKPLSKAEANVLEFLREHTLFQKGPKRGKAKRAASCEQFYVRAIYALEARGLIRFVDNALGRGYVATSIK